MFTYLRVLTCTRLGVPKYIMIKAQKVKLK